MARFPRMNKATRLNMNNLIFPPKIHWISSK
jgi:hypothetical protein